MWFKRSFLASLPLLFISSLGFAEESISSVPENDISIYFLKSFFGPLIRHEFSGMEQGSNIILVLMPLFLNIALIMAFVSISYIGVVSTLRSAHQGSFFGKNASSLLAPAKIGLGVALLVPSSSGYSSLQHIVIWFVLKGIFLANSMWAVIEMDSAGKLSDNNLNNPYQFSADPSDEAKKLTKSIYKLKAAVAFAQNKKSDYTEILFPEKDFDENVIYIRYPGSDEDKGSITPGSKLGVVVIPFDLRGKVPSIDDLYNAVSNPVIEEYFNSGNPFKYDKDDEGDRALVASYRLSYLTAYTKDALVIDTLLSDGANNSISSYKFESTTGWMSAGIKYWDIFDGGEADKAPQNIASELLKELCSSGCDISAPQIFSKDFKGLFNQNKNSKFKGAKEVAGSIIDLIDALTDGEGLEIGSSNRGDPYEGFITSLDDGVQFLARLLLPREIFSVDLDNQKEEIFKTDRMQKFIENNNKIIETLAKNMFATIPGLLLTMFIGTALSGTLPIFGGVLYYAGMVIASIVTIGVTLVPPAIMGSVYVALIPGIIFFCAAFEWFIKVLETVIVAPIVAIGLMHQSEDEFAKVRLLFQQLVVSTFKPALMIIGFVISAKLVNIALIFASVIFTNTFSAILAMYHENMLAQLFIMGIMFNISITMSISLITRAFGAIYLVPDQVFTAIGIRGEQGDESREMLMSIQQAAQSGSQAVVGFLSLTNVVSGRISEQAFKQIKR